MTQRQSRVVLLAVAAVGWLVAAIVTMADGHLLNGVTLLVVAVGFGGVAVTGHLGIPQPQNGPVADSAVRLRSNLYFLTALVWLVAATLEFVKNTPVIGVLLLVAAALVFVPGLGLHRALQNGTLHKPVPQPASASAVGGPPPGEDYPVVSVHTLLRQLRLQSAGRDAQVEGIRSWLADHDAGPALLTSLGRNGYADALDGTRQGGDGR